MRRFLQIARSSANELEYHLQLAKDLQFLPAADLADLEARVLQAPRMLTSFAARVKSAAAS